MEHRSNSPGGDLVVCVARAFQDEMVVAVVVVRMVAAQSLVDQHRQLVPVAQCNGDIERRVLMAANGMMHPVENECAVGNR
jgi:hypothetical protein